MSLDQNRANKPPRCSANKFAEFVFAGSDSRKETIVRDQKYPKTVKVARYWEAEQVLSKFFALGQDVSVLDKCIHQLQQSYSMMPDPFRKNSIEALVALRMIVPLNLGQVAFSTPNLNTHKGLQIGDVFVSMRPNAIVTRQTNRGVEMGAIKMHFPRSSPLGQNRSECIALLMAKYLEQDADSDFTVNRKSCISVDVFPQTIIQGPKAEVRMMNNVEASSRVFASMWNSI